MGSIVASDIFQRKLDSVYIGLPGVTGIADDMIIYGKWEEHDRNFIQFLETTRKNNLQLNPEKLQFKKKEVSLVIFGIPQESLQIQRKLIPYFEWIFSKIKKQ